MNYVPAIPSISIPKNSTNLILLPASKSERLPLCLPDKTTAMTDEIPRYASMKELPECSIQGLIRSGEKVSDQVDASTDATEEKFSFSMKNCGSHFTLRFTVRKDFVKEVRQNLKIFPRLPKRSRLVIIGNSKELVKALRDRYLYQQIEVVN